MATTRARLIAAPADRRGSRSDPAVTVPVSRNRPEPAGNTLPADDRPAPPIELRLRALEQANLAELRAEWRQLCPTDPPRVSRDLLLRTLAYRVQERVFGGLSRASLRRLATGEGAEGREDAEPQPAPRLRPGTTLVREWGGRSHVVQVTETGFDYAGSSYASLTTIARLITGAHWSGPRFFGLNARRGSRAGAGDG